MNKSINLFAIRIKGTDLFKTSRFDTFGAYDEAIHAGVYYNHEKTAELIVKKTMAKKAEQSRFAITENDVRTLYTASKEYFDSQLTNPEQWKSLMPVKFREIELEVVTLKLTLA